MAEYKTKVVEVFGTDRAGTRDVSLASICERLPKILSKADEEGWEVCGILAPQFTTGGNPVKVGVLYRRYEKRYGY